MGQVPCVFVPLWVPGDGPRASPFVTANIVKLATSPSGASSSFVRIA